MKVGVIVELLRQKTLKEDLEYAKKNWGNEDFFTFNNYGWFQFSCVGTAMNWGGDLEQALNKMCSLKVSPQRSETRTYEIYDDMAEKVVADAVKNLKAWGIELTEKVQVVFCDDVNCHMCQVEKI